MIQNVNLSSEGGNLIPIWIAIITLQKEQVLTCVLADLVL